MDTVHSTVRCKRIIKIRGIEIMLKYIILFFNVLVLMLFLLNVQDEFIFAFSFHQNSI